MARESNGPQRLPPRFTRQGRRARFPRASLLLLSHLLEAIAAMRMLVLGAGLQGCACAYDLLHVEGVERVTLADLDPRRIAPFLKKVKSKRLTLTKLDAKKPGALAR